MTTTDITTIANLFSKNIDFMEQALAYYNEVLAAKSAASFANDETAFFLACKILSQLDLMFDAVGTK